MEPAYILITLKYVSVAVGLLSTLWGLTRKITFDDDHGRKRFTAAGHIAVTLIGVSLITTLLSFGFETIIKRDAAAAERAAEQKKATERLQQATNRLEELAEARARAARQEALVLKADFEQRVRDIELANSVNRGSEANLRKANEALTQIQRGLHPLDSFELTMGWRIIALSSGGLDTLAPNLAEHVRKIPRPLVGGGGYFRPGDIWITPESDLYPSKKLDAALYTSVMLPVLVEFYLNGDVKKLLNKDHGLEPDLVWRVRPDNLPDIAVDPDTGDVEFQVTARVDGSQAIKRSGRVVSVSDLDNVVVSFRRESSSKEQKRGALLPALSMMYVDKYSDHMSIAGRYYALGDSVCGGGNDWDGRRYAFGPLKKVASSSRKEEPCSRDEILR